MWQKVRLQQMHTYQDLKSATAIINTKETTVMAASNAPYMAVDWSISEAEAESLFWPGVYTYVAAAIPIITIG